MKNKLIFDTRKSHIELVWGLLTVLAGIALIYVMHTTAWSSKTYSSITRSPVLIPYTAIYGMTIMGVILSVKSIVKIRREDRAEKKADAKVNVWGVILALLWALFAIVMPTVGFTVSGIVCLIVSFWLCQADMRKPTTYIAAIAVPVVFYVIFSKLLLVRFPAFSVF